MLCFCSASDLTKFRIFVNQFNQKYHTIHNDETVAFLYAVSNWGGKWLWSVTIHTHIKLSWWSIALHSYPSQRKESQVNDTFSTSSDEIPDRESLPELDEKGLVIIKDPQVELLCWHYQLHHVWFRVLQTLANLGVLPKKKFALMPPKCAAWCIYCTVPNGALINEVPKFLVSIPSETTHAI